MLSAPFVRLVKVFAEDFRVAQFRGFALDNEGGFVQAEVSTPVAGPSPSGKGKGPAKPAGGNKSSRKVILREPSPTNDEEGDDEGDAKENDGHGPSGRAVAKGSAGKDDEEEEEENMDHEELGKYQTVDPDKMRAVLATFTPEQMSRYECYRRSGFQRANMRRLLQSVSGGPVSVPMTIVISGIAKMFVGELVEMGRIVMTERNDTGPIRPTHLREAYRRLKLEGKVPQRNRPRLFR
uniref:TAFII28-like protein domain-containing protein n=1 Tax=Physcomitrium patens TaxID=3218 RepID=A0A2K1JJE4_PHYPA|nr:hypothetical protein PHYPA_019075 [Physcomitrium patens]